jgi:hypothetical protein
VSLAKTIGKEIDCPSCGKTFYRANYQVKMGTGKFCSRKCFCQSIVGEKHPNWKGGTKDFSEKFRRTKEYKIWRKQVLTRDNYTCVECGLKKSFNKNIRFHAHHKQSFSEYPNLRLDVENGVTLCEGCHQKKHHWKFKDFIMSKTA